MKLSKLQKTVGPGWGTISVEKHPHQWRKIAGENKVYCMVEGCTKTRNWYPAGHIPKTGLTTPGRFRKGSLKEKLFVQCFHCEVFVDPDKDHICDGAEGAVMRNKATSSALGELNRFFFGKKK